MSKRARPDGHAAGKNARRPRIESGQEEIEKQVQKKSVGDAIFAVGRFHDLGVVPALGDHIHGERVIPNCQRLKFYGDHIKSSCLKIEIWSVCDDIAIQHHHHVLFVHHHRVHCVLYVFSGFLM